MNGMRNRREQIKYKIDRNNLKNACPFCPNKNLNRVIEEHGELSVIENIHPYSLWEMRSVNKHFLVIPNRHIKSFSNYSKQEMSDFAHIITKYESVGFNIYTRSLSSQSKSVKHHHTHLIKLNSKTKKYLVYIRRPLLRFVR